ncbi:fimbrillin family protein [Bacteroides sp. 519]|uniref:fimbrillin family protein n=1 Tax=Bacteroides sp. 519 TaxID=2302937 RepID=UPI0013D66862|nr:fimbrillin family protein [Bacteroides sp. 519]NDV59445.1 hypothetical protein [Bacteroides sp. 519]
MNQLKNLLLLSCLLVVAACSNNNGVEVDAPAPITALTVRSSGVSFTTGGTLSVRLSQNYNKELVFNIAADGTATLDDASPVLTLNNTDAASLNGWVYGKIDGEYFSYNGNITAAKADADNWTISCTLAHMEAKLKLTVQTADGSDLPADVTCSIVAPGLKRLIEYEWIDNALGIYTGSDPDITGINVAHNAEELIYPATLAADEEFFTIILTQEGGKYNNKEYKILVPTGGFMFEAGNLYNLTAKLNDIAQASAITLSSINEKTIQYEEIFK